MAISAEGTAERVSAFDSPFLSVVASGALTAVREPLRGVVVTSCYGLEQPPPEPSGLIRRPG